MLPAAISVRRRRPILTVVGIVAVLTFYLSYTRMVSSPFSVFQPAAPPEPASPGSGTNTNTGGTESVPKKPTEYNDLRIPGQAPLPYLSYDTTARPAIKGLPDLVGDLPAEHIPKPGSGKRLIIVGDVHGQKSALEGLLKKVNFDNTKGDHLILAGDLVNKGPDSVGVVQLAMDLEASAVRGNHDDRVLLTDAAFKTQLVAGTDGDSNGGGSSTSGTTGNANILGMTEKDRDGKDITNKIYGDETKKAKREEEKKDDKPKTTGDVMDNLEQNPFSHGDFEDRETAKKLSAGQLSWLSQRPVILRVGTIPGSDLTNLVVVHAGLVPGVALEKQDAWAAMNMRALVYPIDDVRRKAVRVYLEKRAKDRAGKDRKPARVTDEQVDKELARLKQQQHLEVDDRTRQVALPTEWRNGEAWSTAWNRFQATLPEAQRSAVVYGHDARTGLNADNPYTFGLDSGCVYGRQLSAMVIEAKDQTVEHRIIQIDCEEAVKADS